MAKKSAYGVEDIAVLEGLEAVRTRPGMYIGSTDKIGFHHLLWEVIDNSVDEALNGHATKIVVAVDPDDNIASVQDNGRGIPIGKHPKLKRPTVEVVFTTLHSGGKFAGSGYRISGGLHGVGSAVVNALSSELVVTVQRNRKKYTQQFSRGEPGKYKTVKAGSKTGTHVVFTPDPEIFGDQTFDLDLIRGRVTTKAYLTPGVSFNINDEIFKFNGGLIDLLGSRLESEGLDTVTEFPFTMADPDLQVALTWTDDPRGADELVQAFANGIPTRDGGTHLGGLKTAVAEAVKDWMQGTKHWPKRPTIETSDLREGLTGAIHVFVENPQFQGQTKDRLNNSETRSEVRSRVKKALGDWLRDNSAQSTLLAARVIEAARARTASRAARDKVKRKSATARVQLPGKLADCSSTDLEKTELFLVEGDSAGGSAKQGRDRRVQAVLALRGKVINSIREDVKRVKANSEIRDMIEALGTGMGRNFDMAGLRYGKLILLMDADVDGHHISTLMMAFLYKYMRPLIDAGRVYLAQPPLYRVQAGMESFWAADDDQLEDFLETLSKSKRASAEISYFKGLGEMPPKVLYETTMDPATRHLLRIVIPDGDELEAAIIINDLMGNDAKRRVGYLEDCQARTHEVPT